MNRIYRNNESAYFSDFINNNCRGTANIFPPSVAFGKYCMSGVGGSGGGVGGGLGTGADADEGAGIGAGVDSGVAISAAPAKCAGAVAGTGVGAGNNNIAETLIPRIRRAAKAGKSVTFVGSASGNADNTPLTISWARLHQEAITMAAYLQSKGISPGSHVALLGTTSRKLVTAIQAIWLAGGCVIILPIPIRLSSLEEFIKQIRSHLSHGDVSMLLIDGTLKNFYEPQKDDPPILILDEFDPETEGVSASDYQEVADDPERLAVLQFTSGSTSEPKGVMIPHKVIGSNLDAMNEAAGITLEDVIVSWLPLYHDMGLIGMLSMAMTNGFALTLAAPQDFMSKPGNWMRWISQYRATITAGPNFSWVLAARALKQLRKKDEILDLSSLRIALNGAEPIDPDGVDRFVSEAVYHKFRKGAEFCAFGMAEVAIGGCFPSPMRGMVCDSIDRFALEEEGIVRSVEPGSPEARRYPLLGSPVPGLEMRICRSETGEVLGLREVGELEIRGTSVTPGYYKRPDLLGILFHDGWLRTGDLAYFVEGPSGGPPELVMCGRIKDLIIISGRNIYPQDIERAVGEVAGVRTGNVIAFSVEGARGKEVIIVVAEIKENDTDRITKDIRQKVLAVCDVPPKEIVLAQPGTVPKTSSGKLQRSLCKKMYQRNELGK